MLNLLLCLGLNIKLGLMESTASSWETSSNKEHMVNHPQAFLCSMIKPSQVHIGGLRQDLVLTRDITHKHTRGLTLDLEVGSSEEIKTKNWV